MRRAVQSILDNVPSIRRSTDLRPHRRQSSPLLPSDHNDIGVSHATNFRRLDMLEYPMDCNTPFDKWLYYGVPGLYKAQSLPKPQDVIVVDFKVFLNICTSAALFDKITTAFHTVLNMFIQLHVGMFDSHVALALINNLYLKIENLMAICHILVVVRRQNTLLQQTNVAVLPFRLVDITFVDNNCCSVPDRRRWLSKGVYGHGTSDSPTEHAPPFHVCIEMFTTSAGDKVTLPTTKQLFKELHMRMSRTQLQMSKLHYSANMPNVGKLQEQIEFTRIFCFLYLAMRNLEWSESIEDFHPQYTIRHIHTILENQAAS